MNTEQNWKALSQKEDPLLQELLQPGKLQKLQSSNPLHTIKKNLRIHIIWAVLIAIGYVWILIVFPVWQIRLCIGVVLLFTLWATISAYQQYRQLNIPAADSKQLLQQMEMHYNGITKWMQLQIWVALFIYPVAATGGFMLGGIMGSGKTVEEFMAKRFVIISLIIANLVLVPLSYKLTQWMFKKSFGNCLILLEQNIKALKETEMMMDEEALS